MFRGLARSSRGILLLPLLLASLYHLPNLSFSLDRERESLMFLGIGGAVYFAFELAFSRPMRTYVFGHELTHALASLAMGGRPAGPMARGDRPDAGV